MSSKSSISRSLFMLLFMLCTSVLSVSAVGLAKKMLGPAANMVAYIGVQRYTQPITHQVIVSEAKLYHKEMNTITGGKRTTPSVMTALWTGGNQLIFASSVKGKGAVAGNDELQIPTDVQAAFKKCAADFGTHNYDGKCGEIMAISEWYRENPGKSLPKEKVIVTVNSNGVVAPCDANEEKGTYGCTQFLHEMKFDSSEIIDKEPEAEACEVTPPGSPKGSLGKRACKKPTNAPKKRDVSNLTEGTRLAPRRQAARFVSRKLKHRRSVQPRWHQ